MNERKVKSEDFSPGNGWRTRRCWQNTAYATLSFGLLSDLLEAILGAIVTYILFSRECSS